MENVQYSWRQIVALLMALTGNNEDNVIQSLGRLGHGPGVQFTVEQVVDLIITIGGYRAD